MSLPDILQEHLDGEQPVAEVSLGGEDELYVTPTRTLIYRAEGLLSDESVETYPHDAERIEVSESRRKAKLNLDYGLDGTESFAVPKNKLDQVLHPVLAGVLNAADITDAGETVKRTFRFSELTLVVTSARVVKHIGQAVWDDDFEEYHFDDVTDLKFEEGNVATSVVLTVDGRQERFKAPNDQARAVEEAITEALLTHYDVDTIDEFRALSAEEEEETAENVAFGEGPDPLSAGSTEESSEADESTVETGGTVAQTAEQQVETGFQPATEKVVAESEAASTGDAEDDLAAEVEALRDAVDRQQAQLERQGDLIEQLIEELRQGR